MTRASLHAVIAAATILATLTGCKKKERELPDYTPKIQILREHILAVLDEVDRFDKPQLLIWGVGYDSKLWCNENKNGTTVFIEDIPKWAKLAREQMSCRIVMVKYETQRKDWESLIDHPQKLTLELPDDIKNKKFDVIVVDAPEGYLPEKAGRMKSIYMSSLLSTKGSVVFVDDFKRPVENAYAKKYLTPIYGPPKLFAGRGGFAQYTKLDPL